MLKYTVLAAALAFGAAAPALAQGYPPEPPHDYYAAPPAAWAHDAHWQAMKHEQQQAYFDQWRHQRWGCDHGDRGACNWIGSHG
jgi:hypothetical protein